MAVQIDIAPPAIWAQKRWNGARTATAVIVTSGTANSATSSHRRRTPRARGKATTKQGTKLAVAAASIHSQSRDETGGSRTNASAKLADQTSTPSAAQRCAPSGSRRQQTAPG